MVLLLAVPLVCDWLQPVAELGSFQISTKRTHPVVAVPRQRTLLSHADCTRSFKWPFPVFQSLGASHDPLCEPHVASSGLLLQNCGVAEMTRSNCTLLFKLYGSHVLAKAAQL